MCRPPIQRKAAAWWRTNLRALALPLFLGKQREISGSAIATLKRANKVLDSKPSLFGFGVSLNAIIDEWLLGLKESR
jgi:hypothetical protein